MATTNKPPAFDETEPLEAAPRFEDTLPFQPLPDFKAQSERNVMEDAANARMTAGQSDFTRTIATQLPKDIGRLSHQASQAAYDAAAAYAFEGIGEPELQASQLKHETDEQGRTPIEQGASALPIPGQLLAAGAAGVIKTAPQMAATAGLQALGIPAPLAAGGVFGFTPQGFDPKQAAVAAVLPFTGKLSGAVAEYAAAKAGISSVRAMAAINKLGGAFGAAGLLTASQISDLLKLPPEQRNDAYVTLAGNAASMALLGTLEEPSAATMQRRQGYAEQERLFREARERDDAARAQAQAGSIPVEAVVTPQPTAQPPAQPSPALPAPAPPLPIPPVEPPLQPTPQPPIPGRAGSPLPAAAPPTARPVTPTTQPTESEKPDASNQPSPTEVHGPVRPPPGQGQPQVPAPQSGAGIQPPVPAAQTPPGQVPLSGAPIEKAITDFMAPIANGTLTKKSANDIMAQHHGKGMAEGGYTAKDLTDAIETAVNRVILSDPERYALTADGANAPQVIANLKRLVNALPTQTTRSGEMDKMQQFSTPPHFAYVANWVAGLKPADVVLEPSAGVGGLATFAKSLGAKVIGNELSERRAKLLGYSHTTDHITTHNAEHLHALLAPDLAAGNLPPITAVVMNPPFSNAATTSQKSSTVGAQHVEEALKLLPEGGRLVAIVGRGMAADRPAFEDWWARISRQYNVRANLGVSGEEYKKYGTTFGNQIIVIDKSGPTPEGGIKTGKVEKVEDLLPLLQPIRDERPAIKPSAAQPGGVVPAASAAPAPGPGVNPPVQPALPATVPGPRPTVPGQPGGEIDAGLGDNARPANASNPAPAGSAVPPGRVGPPAEGTGGTSVDLPEVQQPGLTVQQQNQGQRELTEHGVFSEYSPQKVHIEGAQPHPTPLVEPTAMAAVAPVDPRYSPKLPQKLITSGALSDAQLENVIYAGQAHEVFLPNGQRLGYFIGDGTGVGKGRQIAGIILDNFNQGRKKSVWISKTMRLMKAAAADVADLGMNPAMVIDGFKNGAGELAGKKEGIAFFAYTGLRSDNPGVDAASVKAGTPRLLAPKLAKAGKKKGQAKISRLQKLYDWLGPEFDGVIALDEAHQAGNAVTVKGPRGIKEASATGLTVLDVQTLFPKARVVYVSATGASDVTNLSYADRLGIWGPGTPFPTKNEFFNQIQAGGLSAMEIIARDEKSMGRYLARTLSFEGVTRRQLVHSLTPAQTKIYNDLSNGWQFVLRHRNETMAATGAAKNGRAIGKANAAFYSAQQRFYNQLLTALQMPSVIEDMKQQLKTQHSVLLQVVNTNEAALNRELAEKGGEELEGEDENFLENLDLSPKDILLQYIDNSYPTALYEPVEDDNGNVTYRPVVDKEGNAVSDPQAVKRKQELMDKMALMQAPSNPLEMLMDTFGVENIAEITGRSKRVVNQLQPDNTRKRVLETNRGEAHLNTEVAEFNEGKRRILIFSDAGGTGFSYHASRRIKNQQRRMHYLIQAGWRANVAIQGLGRSHRSDQASAPEYILASTNIKGHQRFMSTIAKRLGELGAITGGERKSAGGELFSDENNLENIYAENAVMRFFRDLHGSRVEGMSFNDLCQKMGYTTLVMNPQTGEMQEVNRLIDQKTGGLNITKIPPIQQFLNRILVLNLEQQNEVFDAFSERMKQAIENAKAAGTFDPGVQTLKALSIRKLSDEVVYKHPDSTANTRLIEVEHDQPVKLTRFEDIAHIGGTGQVAYVRSLKSGKVIAVKEGPVRTEESGALTPTYRRIRPAGHSDIIPRGDVRIDRAGGLEANYTKLEPGDAEKAWAAEYAAAPKSKKYRDTYLTGAFLPIWDRIKMPDPKIWRITTDNRETFLGAHVPSQMVGPLRSRLNAGQGAAATPESVFTGILEGNQKIELANGWKIFRSKVLGEDRIEVSGLSYEEGREFENFMGGFMERIQFKPRFFIPTDEAAGVKVLAKILKKSPAIQSGGETGPGLVGMGGAVPGEVSAPTIEQQIGGQLAPPRPAPVVTPAMAPVLDSLRAAGKNAWDSLRGNLGAVLNHTFPRTTLVSQRLGELAARWVSSHIAALPMSEVFAADVLGHSGVDPVQLGAALTEDNLRSIKHAFEERADEAEQRDEIADDLRQEMEGLADAANDDPAARAELRHLQKELRRITSLTDEDVELNRAAAGKVKSFIGAQHFPFASEDAYQQFLNAPATREVLARHQDLWLSVVEPQYRDAMQLDPEFELPPRGYQTGARINLRAVREGEVLRHVVTTARAGNLTATFKRKSPFGVRAKGTGESYALNYYDLMANTFARQMEIANKNAFDQALVETGQAVIAAPGQTVDIAGREAKAFPYRRQRVILPPRGGVSQNKDIYVNARLAGEYAIGANVHENELSYLGKILGPSLNRAALAGLTDATTHSANLFSALLTLPGGTGNLLTDSLLSAVPGRPDALIAIGRALVKGLGDNRAQIAALAQIGALKPGLYGPQKDSAWAWLNVGSKLIRYFDTSVRLALDDAYSNLVQQGVIPGSETERREFINQIGQYNLRAQNTMLRFFRKTGLGPFATAGTTFNNLGVRAFLGPLVGPGVKASSMPAAIALRANMLAKIIGILSTIALLNWLLTRKKGGGALGRPGVRLGDIDSGRNDANGNPVVYNVLGMTGFGRGARITGLRGFADAKRNQLPAGTALNTAGRDIINSIAAPFAGPAIRFASVAATGQPPAVDVPRVSRVVPPGGNQKMENLKAAILEANPIVAGIHKGTQPQSSGLLDEFMKNQLPRFIGQPGKPPDMMRNYAHIVDRAQASAFVDDVIGQARRVPPAKRLDFILGEIEKLPTAEDKAKAVREFKYRRVF